MAVRHFGSRAPRLVWAKHHLRVVGVLVFPAVALGHTLALASGQHDPVVAGIQISVGARYDNVRLCVASGSGVKGGPSADISLFTEVATSKARSGSISAGSRDHGADARNRAKE